MPATEQTWRDLRWMHVVFGVSSLVMLVATIWMLAKDHNREWRSWQLADRVKERWALEARLAESKAKSQITLAKLESDLAEARSERVDPNLIEEFKEIVRAEDERLTAAGTTSSQAAGFPTLDEALQQFNERAEIAAEALQAVPPAEEAAHAALVASLEAEESDELEREVVNEAQEAARTKLAELQNAQQARRRAVERATSAQRNLLRKMDDYIREAKRREDALTVAKKFAAADHTAAVSEHGLLVHGGAPQSQVDEKQASIDEIAARIRELDAQVAAAKDYRLALDAIRRQIVERQSSVQKELDLVHADFTRLEDTLVKTGRPKILGSEFLGKTWEAINRGPVLDALYDGNIRIEQIWLPDISINYNFSSVARYDRCITCHRSIDKTAPGSATDPAFPTIPESKRQRVVSLPTPDSPPTATVAPDGEIVEPTLESVYGFVLAPAGQVDRYDVTVQYVAARSLAAQAGLEMGDVILELNGGRIYSTDKLESMLMNAEWGQPLELVIRRGLQHPFTSHPRLDLFVGSLSPHKMGEMGCTICHDGQGSATDFKWASHTPNTPDEADRWAREYGWFNNHHWIFPMTPERFIESNCLKCHHEVVDLEPSERFPEPPAPKLVQGYHLVRDHGCFGCHEVNGYDGPDTRIGPDLRLEPNFHEVAAALLDDPGLSDQERDWAQTLIARPEADEVRHQLFRAIKRDEALGNDEEADEEPRLAASSHQLGELLKDVDTPGDYRKVGPSLRHLGAKVDYEWLYSWIRQPSDFRPTTRMPQFFGLHEHLERHRAEYPNAEGEPDQVTDLDRTERFEAMEVRALAEFLLGASREFAYADPAEGVTEAPSAERGKWLFQSRGCLACHSHEQFPGIDSDQGPDLSRLAAKLGTQKGRRWLYSWLKDPHRYHPRTVMPDLFLDPIAETDLNGQPTGEVTDPAADIVAFLLDVDAQWQPTDVPERGSLTAEEVQTLTELTAEWLSASFPRRRAQRYAEEGIPESQGANVKEDERVLVGMTDANRIEKQLAYVARRSISRYGCFGCHDIPGYESAKPIGTSLADWGRKEPEKLAFENIGQFLATHGIDGTDDPAHHEDHAGGHHGLDPKDFGDDVGYYVQALNSHQRQGFIWQKLRMPRSYDYSKTRNKRYDERLRMPKFSFTDQEREAVITFVLGLVSEPAMNHIYQPDERAMAMVEGRRVLDRFNCGGCHVLDMERWEFAVEEDWFEDPPVQPEFPFLHPDVTEEQLRASLETDRRGLIHVSLRGMPVRNEETGEPNLVDEDGVPLEPEDLAELDPFYEFTLYEDAVVAGQPRLVGVQNLLIPASREGYGPARGKALPANGGDLAMYLFPHVIAKEHESNPAAKGSEAWGWLPPPLVGEGRKVQTDWLHAFLMDPHPIRPAVVMRMPNFRMSSEEAKKLVNYFAAKDNAQWPYEYQERRRDTYLAAMEASHPERMDDALKIVTDGNYCVKCHAVGDYTPVGAIKTQGPQLANVYQRLRPEFVRNWVANPMRILPYTGMPVNIPYADDPPHYGGVSQELYPGTSIEQLNGLVDLLMNFDEYAKRQTTIKSMVKDVAPVDAAAADPEPRPDQAAARE